MKQILFILLLGLAYCGKPEEPKSSAKGSIRFLIGDVTISQSGTKRVAKKDEPINEGDSIQAGAKSAAIVEFEGNAGSVEIQQNSEFIVSKFNAKEQELISKSGSFWLNAKKLNKDTDFRVIMPTATAGIRGTMIYSFEDKESGITGVCHCQGSVDFKDKTSNYAGSHDSDQLVITKDGKTVVLGFEDFKGLGLTSDNGHDHSMIDDSPLGKKNVRSPELNKKVFDVIFKKLAEK